MALLRWDEEEQKDEDLFNPRKTTTIASVQSGWQPTQATGDSSVQVGDTQPQAENENYLISEEKAAVDQQVQQRREAEAAAKAEAARQAAIARENQARAQAAQQVAAQNEQRQPKEYKPKNAGEAAGDFFQGLVKGLWKGGASAVGSGASFISSIVSGDADNDVTKATKDWQKAADKWGDEVHANGVGDFIGSIPGGVVSGIVDPANYMVRGVRNTPEMLAASIAAGSSDANLRKAGIDMQKELQARQFGDDVAKNGDAAMLMEGVAKPGEMILNVATAGGASVPVKVSEKIYKDVVNMAAKEGVLEPLYKQIAENAVKGGVSKSAYRQIAENAAKEGIINVAGGVPLSVLEQTARGQEVTPESVAKDAFLQGLTGATVGAASRGYAISKNRNGVRENASILDQELSPVERTAEEAQVRQNETGDGNVTFEQPTQPVADGFVTPEPINTPQYTPAADNLTPVVDDGIVRPQPLTEAPDQLNGQTPPDWDEVTAKEVAAVREQPTPEVAPVADGTAQTPAVPLENMPTIRGEEVRALQEARAGKSQAEEAVINQQLQEAQASTPRIDSNLPDDMTPVGAEPVTNGIDIEVLKRGISKIDAPKEMKGRIARAVGKELDTELPLSDILADPKVSPWLKDKITTAYNKLEKLTAKENAIQARGIKSVSKGVIPVKDVELTKTRNSLIAERGRAERNLLGYVKQLEGRVSKTARLANITENVVGSKNTNQLTSVALLGRNATQELGGNIQALITNPVAFTKGLFGSGSALKSAGKSALMELTVTPKVMSDVPRYLIGNLYNTLMTPSTALARHRRGMHADASAEMILKTAGIKNPTQAEIRAYSALQGAENEALVNTMVGVFNGMSSRAQANRAADAFAEFIKTGSEAAHKTFLQNLEKQTTLAKSLMDTTVQGLGKNAEGQPSLRHEAAVRIGSAYVNMFLPYLSNVTNLTKTAVSQTLNPLARSTVDQILKSVRSKPENVWAIVKQKSGDYGMLAGVGMMIGAGVIGYNDGEEVDKPRGVYIDLGDGNYIPIRATHVEVPVAAAVTAGMIAKDIASGDMRDAEYYAKIMTASLPYLDSIEQHASAVNSLVKGSSEEGDNMYGAKAWAVNQGRSFVPLSNNAVQQWSARNRGESLNAKKVYDKDMGKWFTNAVRQNYDPAFRDSLEDSRDMAGRVRTVDNQGSVVNKRINDTNTKTYNDTIDDLVTYARQNKLGKGTQDMFNTYPDGKNNNFKSVQDTFTFLDVEDGGKPDNAKKLEVNSKIYDTAQQIRNGFFGDSGAELLTLDGKNLYSDVSVPGKNGGKNTRLPLSMESIKNAIAQTDLPEDQRNALYEIGQQKNGLYERRKAGEITYDQEKAMRADIAAQEQELLQNSDSYKKLNSLMTELDESGFFDAGGLGSTKAGQTYLWNSLNALLGSKGATPAAQWDSAKSYTPYGRGGGGRRGSGSGFGATYKPGDYKNAGIKWTPVGKRQMAAVKAGKYTPLDIKVRLGNAVKKNKTQNYTDTSF